MPDSARLVCLPDDQILLKAAAAVRHRFWVATPFVTMGGVREIEAGSEGGDRRMIVRLLKTDVVAGVMDPDALARLMDLGFNVRLAAQSLHAKCWILDEDAFVGSVNLTANALKKNVELLVRLDSASEAGRDTIGWYESQWSESEPLTDSRLETARLWKKAAQIIRPSVDTPDADEADVPVEPIIAGRVAWIHVGGRSDAAEEVGTPISDFAELQSAATFPANRPPQDTYRGAPMYFVHAAKRYANGRREQGWAIIGSARLRDPVRRVDPSKLAFLRERVTEEGWQEIQRYPHIGWLVGARFLDIPMDQAPFISDVSRPDGIDVVPSTSAFRGGFYILDETRAAALEAALAEAMTHCASISPRADDVIWWSHYLRSGAKDITRSEIESALGPE